MSLQSPSKLTIFGPLETEAGNFVLCCIYVMFMCMGVYMCVSFTQFYGSRYVSGPLELTRLSLLFSSCT